MRILISAVAVVLVCVSTLFAAGSPNTYVIPTTTLSAQTSNNTSAANSFTSQSNGNLGAGNISKVDVHSLLYSGATTKVYAHLMLWFGDGVHMNVGYSSSDPAQIASQIADMVSRGIQGVIIDWYGPGSYEDNNTKLVMAAAEKYPGFTFAIMVDQGAIEWDSCSGCSPQQALIAQLQYIEQTYFPSPAYMTINGRPMVTNFGVATTYSIDWNAVSAALSTQPAFLFQDDEGFSNAQSDGSYSWVKPTTNDYGMSYLTNFYQTGMGYQNEYTVGVGYKGFNDTLAAWGSDRIMGQQCGQTWLQTFGEINGLYNSGTQLPFLQLVTWNDYEEGTEIESGIDNCLTLSASVSNNTLSWKVNGDSELDHYVVYISTDGQNLMPLGENLQPGISSLNLCSLPIPNGNYQVFVQAVGKPSMANHITGAINYNSSCPAVPPPVIKLTASPTSLMISTGNSGNLVVTAQTQSGSLNSGIALSCSGLPSTLSCSFSPASITPGTGSASSTLTISAAAVIGSALRTKHLNPILAFFLLPFGMAGLMFTGQPSRRRGGQILALVAVFCLAMFASSCGGSSSGGSTASGNAATKASSYTVTINGNSSSGGLSATVNVIVQ
jgi:hypothetical protein